MMGTADEIVKAPEKGPIFVEDMPEEEQVVNVVSFLYTTLVASKRQFQGCIDLYVYCLHSLSCGIFIPADTCYLIRK